MPLTAKQIIDKDFEKNYNFYKRIAIKKFKGRYMADDLTQETYIEMLKLKDEEIFRWKDKLSIRVIYKMGHLFSLRNKVKYNSHGNTSTLKEVAGQLFEVECIGYETDFVSNHLEELKIISEEIDKAMLTQNTGENTDSDFMKVSFFLQSLESPVTEISRKTKIPRYYVTNLVKQGHQHLKSAIEK